VDLPFDFSDFQTFRRISNGEATANDLERLHNALGDLYPDTFNKHEVSGQIETASVTPPSFNSEAFERFQAETEIWPTLLSLPFAEQRRYVRQCRCWTPALFHFLHQKSREEGRLDRQRGKEISQLVLDLLDENEELLGTRTYSLRAQAWAWLCNARRLALDFVAAGTAIGHAESALQIRECRGDAFAHGIVYVCKGTLRMFQRRHQEAIDLFDIAFGRFEEAGDCSWQIRTLLHRAAALIYSDSYKEAEPTLKKATALLDIEHDEHLAFRVKYTMSYELVKIARFDDAKAALATITKEHQVRIPTLRFQIQWVEGTIDHGLGKTDAAEASYLSAQRGFETLNELLYEALVVLDLTVLYAETEQMTKVIENSIATCRFFESIKLYDETLANLELLRIAIHQTDVTAQSLRALRSALWRDPLMTL
jgi:tetratricopeptide (TPR) repeat protein